MIPADTQEELIYLYIKLRYQWVRGWIPKIGFHLERRAIELGTSLRSAWRIVRRARDIGMIEGDKYLEG